MANDNQYLEQTPVVRYQSIFTGQQIDERLREVTNKVSISDLEQSYSGGEGLPTIAVSAFALKGLKDYVDGVFEIFTGESSANLLPFTQELYDRLQQNNWWFQGIWDNAALRDASIVPGTDTLHFIGVEMSILVDNGAGERVLQKWNTGTETWEDFMVIPDIATATEIPSAGTYAIGGYAYPTPQSSLFYIAGMSDGGIMQSVIASIIYDGSDSYITTFAEVSSNNTPWFTLTVTGGPTLIINAVALDLGTISIKSIDSL